MTHAKKQMNAGYTIDQTILIIAIIAILITIIIATVGWDLLQRAGGAKLASHLRQVEGAIGEFYARHKLWPHEAVELALTANSLANAAEKARVLNSTADATEASFIATEHKPGLPSYTVGAGNQGLVHTMAADGAGSMRLRTLAACGGITGNVYQVEYTELTLDEVERANAAIDGAREGSPDTSGRVQWTGSGNAVNLRYCANRF